MKHLFFNFNRLLLLGLAVMTVGNVWGDTYSMTPDQTTTGSSATTYITSLTEFSSNNITWKMNQWNPKTLQIKTNQSSAGSEFRFYNNSAFPARIVSVVVKFSALTLKSTTSSGFKFVGGTSAVTGTSGGTDGTWNSTATTLTWTPADNTAYTYFAMYQNGKVASGTNYLATSDAIVVTYGYAVTKTLTNCSAEPAIPAVTAGFTTTITANSGYQLPSSITVSGASYTWNSSTGALAVTKVTGPVTITIEAQSAAADKWYIAGTGLGVTDWQKIPCDNNGNVTLTNISSGTHQFKIILNDTWSGNDFSVTKGGTVTGVGTSGENRTFTLSKTSDIDISIYNWAVTKMYGMADFYVTGDGWCGTSWQADGRQLTADGNNFSTKVTNVAAGDHKMKVTDGTWNATWGGTAYSSEGSSGITKKDDDGDGNLVFNVASKSNVTVTFNKQTRKITLVAVPVYTVTYSANGATSGTAPADADYESGTPVTVAGNTGSLEKTGYEFGGWNTKEDGSGTNYTAGTGSFTISANTPLYAKWTIKSYTVTKGTVTGGTATVPSSVNHGGDVTVTDLTPDGTHKLPATVSVSSGDYSSIDGATIKNVTSNITVNVTFTAKTQYTVTLLNNGTPVNAGGFDAQGKKTYYEGETLGTLPTLTSADACDNVEGGSKTFMGWTTETISTKQSTAPSYKTSSDEVTDNMTLRAVWAREK